MSGKKLYALKSREGEMMGVYFAAKSLAKRVRDRWNGEGKSGAPFTVMPGPDHWKNRGQRRLEGD